MIIEEISTSLIMWFLYALIPSVSTDGVAVLPAPQNLSVHSANMKHLLTWSPVVVPGEIIYYSVEYQGEYEILYLSHLWIPSHWCSSTKGPQCDITDDITATVQYNLRVRATLGSQTSAWSTLEHPFNRNSTILTPPKIKVTKDGFHLVIELEDLGPQFEFYVVYWRNEPGAKHVIVFSGFLKEHVQVVKSGGIPVHLETMEPGARYCMKAQTFVKAIERHSAFSQAECIEVQGDALSLTLALFAFVGFMLLLVTVLLSIWKMGQLLRYSCCPVVVLPDTLVVVFFYLFSMTVARNLYLSWAWHMFCGFADICRKEKSMYRTLFLTRKAGGNLYSPGSGNFPGPSGRPLLLVPRTQHGQENRCAS